MKIATSAITIHSFLRKKKFTRLYGIYYDPNQGKPKIRKKFLIGYQLFLFLVKIGICNKRNIKFLLLLLMILMPREKYWYKYLLLRESNQTFFLMKKALFLLKNNETILDVGCAAGHFFSYISSQGKKKLTLVGIDNLFESLLLARLTLPKNTILIFYDAEKGLPLPSVFFQKIFAHETLGYIEKKQFFFKEIYRCLAFHGCVLITTIHNTGFGINSKTISVKQLQLLVRRFFTKSRVMSDQDWLNCFSYKKIFAKSSLRRLKESASYNLLAFKDPK